MDIKERNLLQRYPDIGQGAKFIVEIHGFVVKMSKAVVKGNKEEVLVHVGPIVRAGELCYGRSDLDRNF